MRTTVGDERRGSSVGVESNDDVEPATGFEPGDQPDETESRGGRLLPSPGRPAVAIGVLVALVLAKALYYARIGPALILDDWRLIYNTQLFGVMHTLEGSGDAASRPVAWVWFNVVYAIAGSSPMRLLVFVTLLNVAIVVLLYRVLTRTTTPQIAVWVTGAWIVLPTHTALSVWGGVVQALLSIVLFLGGMLWLTRGRWVGAAVCFVGATLCYQVAIPLAVLAVLVLPVEGGMARRDRFKILAAVGAASLWVALHPTYPTSFQVPDVPLLWRAHFGTGLFASNGAPAAVRTGLAVLVLVAVVVSAVAWVRGRRTWDEGPSLVLLGVVVWVGGLLVLVSTPRWVQAGEFGLTDRVFGLSSVGSAMVLVGVLQALWRRARPAGVVWAGGLVGVCLLGQYVALHSWSAAGEDARAMLDHLQTVAVHPNATTFLVGPDYPGRNNVISLEADAVYFAHKIRYPPGNSGTVTFFNDAYLPLVPDQVMVVWPDISDDLPQAFYAPIAGLDSVTASGQGLRVAGWALDRSTSEPIGVEIFVDGAPEPALTLDVADDPRPALVPRYGLGADHGFDEVVEDVVLSRGEHTVCVRGIVFHDGRRALPRLMQCGGVTVGADPDQGPVGVLDSATADPDGIRVGGWAIDPLTPEPTGVSIHVDGADEPYGVIARADRPRPDLEDAYRLGPDHGFNEVLVGPPLAPGRHEVCLRIEAVGDEGVDAEANCLVVEVPGP